MRILLSCILAYFILNGSFAHVKSLRESYAELSFALESQWDQNDPYFYKNQMSLFIKNIRQAQLDSKQILEFAESQINDRKFFEGLMELRSQLDMDKLTEEQLIDLSLDFIRANSPSGGELVFKGQGES